MSFSFNSFNESAYWGHGADPHRVIAAAARAGYDLVGLDFPTISAFCESGGQIGDIARMFSDEGVGCSTVTAAGMYGDGNDVAEVTKRAAEWAAALGAPYLQSNFMSKEPRQQLGELETACRAVESINRTLRIAIEHMPTFGLNTLNEAVELTRQVGHERAGVLVDIWHVSHSQDSWADLEAMPMEALAYIELCDALPPISDDLGFEMTMRRTFPGQGILEVERFCRLFADRGYRGMVSLEVVSEEWRNGDLDAFARQCLSSGRRLWPHG